MTASRSLRSIGSMKINTPLARAAKAIAAAALLIGAADAPSPLLEPNGPWLIEAEDNLCLLTRSYGSDANKVTVGLQPLFTDDQTMDLIVLTHDASPGQKAGTAAVRFAPTGRTRQGEYFSVQLGDGRRFTRITLSGESMDDVRAAQEMSIRAKPASVRVHLVRTDAALTPFSRCQTDLLKFWGVDPAALAPERAPKPRNLSGLFSPSAYPTEALNSNLSGRVVAVLQVDATGVVTACRVVSSAGPALNAGTCREANRLRFRPGTDPGGKPTPSIYVLPVRWMTGSV